MKKLVVASNNAHKVEEIQRMLQPCGWECVPLVSCGNFEEPVEDADTFEGNARIKALAAHKNTGLPALADDSGLVVDALDGAPGVYSSRYAGESASDAENNKKLLEQLVGVPSEKRTARFVCTLVFIEMDGSEFVTSGTCEGKIANCACGDSGFGYDPLFIADKVPEKTVAQLCAKEKDAISHRGAALRQFADFLVKREQA